MVSVSSSVQPPTEEKPSCKPTHDLHSSSWSCRVCRTTPLTYSCLTVETTSYKRTSSHSLVARTAMSNCIVMSSPNPLPLQGNLANTIPDRDFTLPNSLYPHSNQLTVPGNSSITTGSLGHALQQVQLNMTSCENAQNGENGLHRTLSDTPPRSESSTAPGSPRM